MNTSKTIWSIIGGLSLLALSFIPLSMVLGVQYDYTLITVATGGATLGIISGVLGSFAVLRRQSLMGDALSHAALPGVAIAFLLAGRELSVLLIGAGVAGWVSVLFISAVTQTTRLKQDTAMGISLAGFFALGIALLTYIQSRQDASQAGLSSFIFGQAAAIVRQDVLLMSGVGLVAFGVLALFWKEFKLITFDPEFAGANGYPIRLLDMLLATLIVVAIVLGLQVAGVILMVGMLIAPAVAARQWTHNLGQMITLAAIFGGFAGASGAVMSGLDSNLPTGPLIIVSATSLVVLSLLFAPERGLVWSWWQERQNRYLFASQQLLQDIYRHALQHGDRFHPTPEGLLVALRGQTARFGLRELQKAGYITTPRPKVWALTEAGFAQLQAHSSDSFFQKGEADYGEFRAAAD